uniref:Uncharacterized protein n=1 Tax=Angiostrongylus cantonensis TaxID=6313 RepID=A0A0K0DQQ6_ANGCA
MFISRLRAALDVNTNVPDGESMCVSVHAALEMVSESMRDLFKHSQFKTNYVILPSLQLVQSVKGWYEKFFYSSHFLIWRTRF